MWSPPVGADLAPGEFVFTIDGELTGLVVMNNDDRVIVPGEVLLAEVVRLLKRPAQPAGAIGVQAGPPSSRAKSLFTCHAVANEP